MYELKQLFSHIGSRNEYIKIAVLLMFVMFILSAVLGRKATVIIGVIALIFTCLGAAFWLRGILSESRKNKKPH
ncbi:MAG: hypothetical protein JRD49_04705 [Deltaproteobacteria bacterium]|nr:hypothetical protein [Deltaproteobacteria bacterium]MBW2676847.1 hypothetical protein [Deltaproteobacteria bacterium]